MQGFKIVNMGDLVASGFESKEEAIKWLEHCDFLEGPVSILQDREEWDEGSVTRAILAMGEELLAVTKRGKN